MMEFDSDDLPFSNKGPQKLSGDPAVHLSGGGNQGVTANSAIVPSHPQPSSEARSGSGKLGISALARRCSSWGRRGGRAATSAACGVEQLHNINEKRESYDLYK